SDAQDQVRVARKGADGKWVWHEPIDVIKPRVRGLAHPAGIAAQSADEFWVTSTRGNNVQLVNLATGQAEQLVQVGVAPFMVCPVRPDKVYVSNWGGDPPRPNDPQARTSDTPIRIDPKTGIANHGTVSVIAPTLGKWKQVKTIPVGLHPCALLLSRGGKF